MENGYIKKKLVLRFPTLALSRSGSQGLISAASLTIRWMNRDGTPLTKQLNINLKELLKYNSQNAVCQ